MIFTETKLKGAYIIGIEKHEDERGFFARSWCKREFQEIGLNTNILQSNIAFSKRRGTLRGLHYQTKPYEETKFIRCTKGIVYDTIIDLRPESSTYKKWVGIDLAEDNYRMLYVPEGFAHGYVTLTDNVEVSYQVSQFYALRYERGIRYNDPAFGINWPIDILVISDKDKSWPDYCL